MDVIAETLFIDKDAFGEKKNIHRLQYHRHMKLN